MDILPSHFRYLQYCGLWWESDKQHWFMKYVWKPLIVNIIFIFTLSQMAALIAYRRNTKDAIECLYSGATYLTLCFKMINFLLRREQMIGILNQFREQICTPQTSKESDVVSKYTQLATLIFKLFLGTAQLVGTLFYLVPVLYLNSHTAQLNLPFKIYEFWSKENILYYSITYTFQTIALIIGIAVNVCLDSILCGFLLITCGQIDLSCHRLVSASQSGILLSMKDFVIHHIFIKDIVRHLESFFMSIIIPFLFFSLFTLCTTIFILSQNGIKNVGSLPSLLYLGSLMAQIFLYCWSGNELTLKGTKVSYAMYNYEWSDLKPYERRYILYVMLMGQQPLTISFHGLCTVSLDVYVWVLKTSYAAYSILQNITIQNKL